MTTLYDFTVDTIDGQRCALATFEGQVVLVVNTASRCGFTPQLADLETLHRNYQPRGFTVLGFPCDQFLGQELATDAEVSAFCARTFDTHFPLMRRINVNGRDTAPVFAWLKRACPGFMGSTAIKWNFTKFLIDHRGQPVRRYAPSTRPTALEADIENCLSRRA